MDFNLQDTQLIKNYLYRRLSSEEEIDFNQRLSSDKDFRAEVSFQTQLFASLRDRETDRLKKILQQAEAQYQNPLVPKKPNHKLWVYGIVVLLILMTLFFLLTEKIKQPSTPTQPETPTETPKKEVLPNKTPNQQSTPNVILPKETQPVAKAADLAPNTSFEVLISSQLRSETQGFILKQPIVGDSYQSRPNEDISLHFEGSILPVDGKNIELKLDIYNNKNRKPIFTGTYGVQKFENKSTFDFQQKLKLNPGLYYYVFENQETGELVWVGKLLVL
jgi:hypothetical protein